MSIHANNLNRLYLQFQTAHRSLSPNASHLVRHFLAPQTLLVSYRRIRSNKGASGLDGVTYDKLAGQLIANWPTIYQAILEKSYIPSPLLELPIRKNGNLGIRKLRLPSMKDRFLQHALLQVIVPLIDSDFSPSSFAYRPHRGIREAVASAQDILNRGEKWVARFDIKDCFDSLNHHHIISRLKIWIRDPVILNLLIRYIHSGVIRRGRFRSACKGVAQGGPLSPILSNVALDDLDRTLDSHCIPFIRYADDGAVFANSLKKVQERMKFVELALNRKLGLEINKKKTRIQPPGEAELLGFAFREDHQGLFRRHIAPEALQRFKEKVTLRMEAFPSDNRDLACSRISNLTRGWQIHYRNVEDPKTLKQLAVYAREQCAALRK